MKEMRCGEEKVFSPSNVIKDRKKKEKTITIHKYYIPNLDEKLIFVRDKFTVQ